MKLGGFALFLAIFLSLYGGMHYYIYKKLAPLIPSAQVYIAWTFVLLVVSPVIIQLLVKLHWISLAQI
ncbi:MAG: hypothetical protein P8Z67_15480, partial [Gammaproteobacteria bacterium]